jgi:excisionase family DNA binding protein
MNTEYRGAMKTRQPSERELAQDALKRLKRRPRKFRLPDGTLLELPAGAIEALIETLQAASEGDTSLVVRSPREVTTQQAADLLNVSRPTLVKLLEEGRLPYRKVGTHRRIPLRDLLSYREADLARRRRILDEMAKDAEALGLYD